MSTIYGESSITSYAGNGGIAVMSADDLLPGTVTGGSGDREEGSAGSVTRIKWTITYDGNEFSGGITNSGWYRSGETPGYDNGPFQNATDEEIYREASTVGNLDSFFNNWNNSVSPRDILGFQMAIYDYNDACITIGGMGS